MPGAQPLEQGAGGMAALSVEQPEEEFEEVALLDNGAEQPGWWARWVRAVGGSAVTIRGPAPPTAACKLM